MHDLKYRLICTSTGRETTLKMSTTKLSDIQRQAVWEIYDRLCFYCRQPVFFKNINIDHFIPRSVKDLKKTVADYGLPSSFEIESYENYLLACQNCNFRKSGYIFSEMPIGWRFAKDAHNCGKKIAKKVAEMEREMKAEIERGYPGHYVRFDHKLAEIFVKQIGRGYELLLENHDGLRESYHTNFPGGNAYFQRAPELDYQNDTEHPGPAIEFKHLGNGIVVDDQKYFFSGIYERTAYTHSIFLQD